MFGEALGKSRGSSRLTSLHTSDDVGEGRTIDERLAVRADEQIQGVRGGIADGDPFVVKCPAGDARGVGRPSDRSRNERTWLARGQADMRWWDVHRMWRVAIVGMSGCRRYHTMASAIWHHYA